jgi:uncharacterized protein YceK
MRTTLVLLIATWILMGCSAVHTAHNVARSAVGGTATAVKTVEHGTATVARGTAKATDALTGR